MLLTQYKMSMAKEALERRNAIRVKASVASSKGATATATTTQRVAFSNLQNQGKDAFQLYNANLRCAIWKESVEVDSDVDATKPKEAATNNAGDPQMHVLPEPIDISDIASTDGNEMVSGKSMESTTLLCKESILLGEPTNKVGDRQMQISLHSNVERMHIRNISNTIGNGLASQKSMESTTLLSERLNVRLRKLHINLNAQPGKPHSSGTTIDVVPPKMGEVQICTVAGVIKWAVLPKPKIEGGFSKRRFGEVMVHATHPRKLLDGVKDIDARDKHTLVFVAEYVNDIYDYLYSLEAAQCIQKDHLAGQTEVQRTMRSKLIDWVHAVHVQFSLTIETFQMGVSIIDLYLQTVKDTQIGSLQLVAVTALFIAAKYEELFPPTISDYVLITDKTYSSRQICLMEQQILKALNFNLSRPVPMHFLRRYSKAAGAQVAHHNMSKYFIELTAIQYDLASYKPSEIAAASTFLTLHLLKDDARLGTGFNNNHWNKTLTFYSRYTPENLRPITKKIAAVVRNANQAQFKSVYTKYGKSILLGISKRFELYSPLIDSIVNSKD